MLLVHILTHTHQFAAHAVVLHVNHYHLCQFSATDRWGSSCMRFSTADWHAYTGYWLSVVRMCIRANQMPAQPESALYCLIRTCRFIVHRPWKEVDSEHGFVSVAPGVASNAPEGGLPVLLAFCVSRG